MACEEMRAYVDTTLAEERSPEMLERIRRHAEGCPACAAYLAETARVERELRGMPAIPAEATVLENVMRRVLAEASGPAFVGASGGEVLRWVVFALGASIAAAAYAERVLSGEWLSGLLTVRWRPGGVGSRLFEQPASVMLLCGVGAVLAAAAILWQGSREEQAADVQRAAICGST